MSKTIKNVFNSKLTFDNFLKAHDRASKGKKSKKEVILFEMDLETNLIKIINELKSNDYKSSNYREFVIYEPKMRIIKSLPYKDRIIHQWYVYEFIKPLFYPKFIKDSYACIDDKGTHNAVKKVQQYMRKMKKKYKDYYVLKCDIKRFFYSIDRKILLNIFENKISDKKLIQLTKGILSIDDEKGIPIGNYTSQFFANIYLDKLDHYVKERLKIKYYVRYMDDFILLLPNSIIAKEINQQIKEFVEKNLALELNKKTKYFSSKLGVDFCGYRIYETHILLRKRFKKKFKKNINLWNRLYCENKLDNKKMQMSLNSFIAHASHCNSYNFRTKALSKLKIDNIEN